MAHDVFISYSTRDKALADAVCAKLEERKVRCWVAPRDVVAGSDYGEALSGALKGCRILVLVLSSASNSSIHVKREVEIAVVSGKIILPFRIEEIELSASLRYFLGGIHWLDALTPPVEMHLIRLAESVSLLLGPGGERAWRPGRGWR